MYYDYISIIILIVSISLLFQLTLASFVSFARYKFKVKAPAITGNENFERIYRTHQNNGEQLLIFIPAFLIFCIFFELQYISISLGVIWILSRLAYSLGYIQNKKSLTILSHSITMTINMILLAGLIYLAISNLFINKDILN